ncbi:MAG: protein-disulfide reductase DsbD [Moraxellaceae bacterium]|nr:protein-disulfide reductase DsbD [Moraxellaceae bacterium]
MTLYLLPPCPLPAFSLRSVLVLLCLLVCWPASANLKKFGTDSSGGFLPVEEAFQLVSAQEPEGLLLDFRVTPGHYLYKTRFRFDPVGDGLVVGEPVFSQEGEWKDDPAFGRVQVFNEDVSIRLPLQGKGSLTLVWQGCAEAGLCYPPQTVLLGFGEAASPPARSEAPAAASTPATNSASTPATDTATGNETGRTSLWLMLGAGLLLAFTPCVLPMLPILAGIIARQHTRSTARGLALASAYVLGVASTYALTGFLVGLLGAQANLPLWFQHPVVTSVFALFFVLLALSLLGLFELRLPQALHNRLDDVSRRHKGGALVGSWLMGVFSALVVSPCVTAPLAGVLLHVASTGDALYGARSLFVLALGMGLPLLVLGATEGRLLPKAGQWMHEVKTLFGLGLLVVAAELLSRVVPAQLALLLYAFCAAATGLWLWRLGEGRDTLGLLVRGLAVVALLYAGSLVVGAASGNDDPLRPLSSVSSSTGTSTATPFILVKNSADLDREIAAAGARGQTVMLDFYADWCVSCKVMERRVFRDPAIAARLGKLHLLQADITANNLDDRGLLQRFTLFGPPAILFFGPDGREISAARLVGEKDAAGFMAHLEAHGL